MPVAIVSWGVVPLKIPASDSFDDMVPHSIHAARKVALLESGRRRSSPAD